MTNNHDRLGPLRTCVGCRSRRPQASLVRCVLGSDGSIEVGRSAPGRGAWLCGVGCLDAARRGGFDRAWRTRVSPEAIDELWRLLDELTN